jgi:hypothetical protein
MKRLVLYRFITSVAQLWSYLNNASITVKENSKLCPSFLFFNSPAIVHFTLIETQIHD